MTPTPTPPRLDAEAEAMLFRLRTRIEAGHASVAIGQPMLREITSLIERLALRHTPERGGPERSAEAFVATHRHVKRGTLYQFIDEADLQTETPLSDYAVVSVYRGKDGRLWVRPRAEFNDGRFEALPAPRAPLPERSAGWPTREEVARVLSKLRAEYAPWPEQAPVPATGPVLLVAGVDEAIDAILALFPLPINPAAQGDEEAKDIRALRIAEVQKALDEVMAVNADLGADNQELRERIAELKVGLAALLKAYEDALESCGVDFAENDCPARDAAYMVLDDRRALAPERGV